MKKNLIIILSVILLSFSCSVKNMCGDYLGDSSTFRANALASSKSPNLAAERALLSAKQEIAKDVDDYIKEKYELQTFREDSVYQSRIITARKTVLNNIQIICSHRSTRKGLTYGHVAIEISHQDIDDHVQDLLKRITE